MSEDAVKRAISDFLAAAAAYKSDMDEPSARRVEIAACGIGAFASCNASLIVNAGAVGELCGVIKFVAAARKLPRQGEVRSLYLAHETRSLVCCSPQMLHRRHKVALLP